MSRRNRERRTRERAPYRGKDTSLIISIDLGTTFSGSSWSLLEPQQIPEVVDVAGYLDQEFLPASTKVPTVIYYDREGVVRAAGSEIFGSDFTRKARKQGWIRVEWFKLLLRPRGQNDALAGAPISPLPPGKTVTEVVGDFLAYMSRSAIEHFHGNTTGAEDIWERVNGKVIYILSHPNGWDTYQHNEMRRAAIYGDLVLDTEEGRSRIHFVSEGEASLHWCIMNPACKSVLKIGSEITVVDAGGGTIDVSSYRVIETTPLKLEERVVPDSQLAGSVFITKTFETFAKEKLEGSAYGEEETISRLVLDFDKVAKCVFKDRHKESAVTFGTYRENDPEYDIDSGQLIIEGSDMMEFYEASCTAAADAVRKHASLNSQTTVFIVGGFAASPWLCSELKDRVQDLNLDIMKAETMTAKAAANGAVSYYLDHRVSARVAKWTYGVFVSPAFIEYNLEHLRRRKDMYVNRISGRKYVSGGFRTHITKGTIVQETQSTRVSISRWLATDQNKTMVRVELVCYKGNKKNIEWTDEDPLNFETLCSFSATIPASSLKQEFKVGSDDICWRCEYDAVVSFGTTEFKCQIEWKDDQGVTQSGSATPVWNEG